MSSPARGSVRAVRGAVASLTGLALALLGHLAAAGAAPTPEVVVILAGLMAAAFTVLGRRRRSFAEIAAALMVAQAVFHVGFGLGHRTPSGQVPPEALTALPSTSMVLAHVVAGVATAALLAYGEAAVWAVLHLMASALALAFAPPLRVSASLWSVQPVPHRVASFASLVVSSTVRRRGPPAALSV